MDPVCGYTVAGESRERTCILKFAAWGRAFSLSGHRIPYVLTELCHYVTKHKFVARRGIMSLQNSCFKQCLAEVSTALSPRSSSEGGVRREGSHSQDCFPSVLKERTQQIITNALIQLLSESHCECCLLGWTCLHRHFQLLSLRVLGY